MDHLVGQRFGQYEITALIGKGGMAAVYRARQASIDRDVAIKVIKPDLAELSDFIKRFEREAKVLASLSHANILKIFDYGQSGDNAYLVMELLNGGNLAERIVRGPIDLPTVTRLLEQIASALDYAHRRGIIHRDLKPQNVLLDDGGNALLTDFGLAKLLSETSALTHSGAVMGTPLYMAPEQWQGEAVDARADIYALGVMLFEMLAGFVPFNGATPYRIMHMHIFETHPSLIAAKPELPPSLDAVLKVALAKNRDERFSSAGELAIMFRAALAGADVARSLPAVTTNSTVISDSATLLRPTTTPNNLNNTPTSVGARLLRPTGPAGAVLGTQHEAAARSLPPVPSAGLSTDNRRSRFPVVISLVLAILAIGGMSIILLRDRGVLAVAIAPTSTPSSTHTPSPKPTRSPTPKPSATRIPTRTPSPYVSPTLNALAQTATAFLVTEVAQVGDLPRFTLGEWVSVPTDARLSNGPTYKDKRSFTVAVPPDTNLARIMEFPKVGEGSKGTPVYWYFIYIVPDVPEHQPRYLGWLAEDEMTASRPPELPATAQATQTALATIASSTPAATPLTAPLFAVNDLVNLYGFVRASPGLQLDNLVNVHPNGRYRIKAIQPGGSGNHIGWWCLLSAENDMAHSVGWASENNLSAISVANGTPVGTASVQSN